MQEVSILKSTKKVLGIDPSYEAFDADILMHLNSIFATLNQLGVGPVDGFEVEDETATWDAFLLENPRFNFVKSYIQLSVRLLFDPPATSFAINAMKEQKAEFEWRISVLRESGVWIPSTATSADLDGGNAVGG